MNDSAPQGVRMSEYGPLSMAPPIVPRSFSEYVRSFGPGIVIVLTWLGAGDVVDMATAGANYGYALLWVFVVAVLFRFLFVSLIARYQLCNQHGEGVLDGLARLHPLYAPVLLVAAIVMGHVYGSYMTRGVGEICQNVFGFGAIWQWAILCNGIAFYLVFQPELSRGSSSSSSSSWRCCRCRFWDARSGWASIPGTSRVVSSEWRCPANRARTTRALWRSR